MTVPAEKAVCAWVNQTSGLAGTTGAPGPLAQGAYTIEQRSPVGAGAYALVIRQQGPVQRMVAETSDLDCATIVQRDCPFSVLLSDDLGPSWVYASSIEKVILRCLK